MRSSDPAYPPHLSRSTLALFQQLEAAALQAEQHPERTIHVSEVASLPSYIYERLRNIVDYKDEYLLRKNATKRFLKRTFLLPHLREPSEKTALALVRELVLSRYLTNDSLPEAILPPLTLVLRRYYLLLEQGKSAQIKAPRWRQQVIGLAAVECDALLVSHADRIAYTTYATGLLKPVLKLAGGGDEELRVTQLVICCQRVLERADRDIVNYYLLRHHTPGWFAEPADQAVAGLLPKLGETLTDFAALLEHPLGRRLMPYLKRLLIPLLVFRSVAAAQRVNLRELVERQDRLLNLVREAYEQYWNHTRSSIRRKGFHAMAYIFMTKVAIALLLELPYEQLVVGHITYLPLGINLIFPPCLMAVITLLIRAPGKVNSERTCQAVLEMVYAGTPDFFKPRELKPRPLGKFRRFAYGFLYTLTMAATLAVLVSVLRSLGFNVISGTLFIFFVSLVSFFGINLRQQARQFRVVQGRETFAAFLVDFFTLPVVGLGKWLSTTFDRYNFFVFLLDFLFEVPFKLLLKVLEHWFQVLREKKDEMY